MNIANLLTFFRILTAPIVLAMFFTMDGYPLILWVTVICVLSELSDIFDGYFSRKFNTTSDFGKLADPFADSFFRLTVFFGFAYKGWIPLWMPILLMYRDIIVSALRMYALQNNLVIGARNSGKIKAIIQASVMFGILLMIFRHHDSVSSVLEQCNLLGYIAVLVTMYSLVDYTIGIIKGTKK